MDGIAFYAPMKSPNHPVPSGDRELARSVMAALGSGPKGLEVRLASELRCYDGEGDATTQSRLFREAKYEVDRLVAKGGWSAWVTYHNYYKAPDLVGSAVSRALDIPYFQIESTRAGKRLGGPWDRFEKAAEASCEAAAAVFYVTRPDAESLFANRPDGQQVVHLPPFLARETLPPVTRPKRQTILCVGMMREGDKLASYKIISAALNHLDGSWICEIAGDGPARDEVENLFASFGSRVRFLGQLDAEGMSAAYGRASVMLWPGVNEAFGMTYIEAQAAGVPVVAQDRPGVRDVLPSSALVPVDDMPAIALSVSRLLNEKSYWTARGTQARDWVKDRHLIGTARDRLWSVIAPFLKGSE